MNKKTKDTKIKEMVQHWIDKASPNEIEGYAYQMMQAWYKDQPDNQIKEFYKNHVEQVKKDQS